MTDNQIPNLADLPKYTLQDWLKATEESLKKGNLEDLFSNIDGIEINPILDYSNSPQTSPLQKQQTDWYIGSKVQTTSSEELNKTILQQLNHGAEAISLKLTSENDPSIVFEGVNFEYIYSDLELEDLHTLPNIDISNKHLKGNLSNGGSIAPISFHTKTVHVGSNQIIEGLTEVCIELIKLFDQGNISPNQIRISLSVDKHIPISVSKIRAIRILWLNILEAYQLKRIPAFIVCDQFAENEDSNTALIELSVMAMNAVLGGCDLLYLDGYNFDQNQRRLAMNIQHIMKMESKLHLVQDPLAGAYSIENITQQIVDKVWHNISVL